MDIIDIYTEDTWTYKSDAYFFKHRNLLIGFSTRLYDDVEDFLRSVNLGEYGIMKQTHSDVILKVSSPGTYRCDGMYTDLGGLVLVVKVADCLPVFFFNSRYVGVVHAGWRGFTKGILYRVKAMGSFKYVIGPSIRGCCYEVGDEVAEEFIGLGFDEGVERRNGKVFVDIYRAALSLLGKESILTSLPLCTRCNSHIFYSHRARDTGRNYGFIVRLP